MEKIVLDGILFTCNVGVLVLFVFVLGRTATSGGNKSAAKLQERVLERAKKVASKVAVKQAHGYIDTIFDALLEAVEAVAGKRETGSRV